MPSEAYIGEIFMAGFNYAPKGYLPCDGRLLAISGNDAIFSLLGTTFGGDGVQTFGLPDLRGRVPLAYGQGPGLTSYQIGEKSGTESVTLNQVNMPQHTHPITLACSNAGGTQASPAGAYPAADAAGASLTYSTTHDSTMAAGNTGLAGGSQPFSIMQPYAVLNFYICVEGIYPSRP